MKTVKQTTGIAKSRPGELSNLTLLARLSANGDGWTRLEPSEILAARRLASRAHVVFSPDRSRVALTTAGRGHARDATERLRRRTADMAAKVAEGERRAMSRKQKRPRREDYFSPEIRRQLHGHFVVGSITDGPSTFRVYYSGRTGQEHFRVVSVIIHSDRLLLDEAARNRSTFYQNFRTAPLASLGPRWVERLRTGDHDLPTVPPLDTET